MQENLAFLQTAKRKNATNQAISTCILKVQNELGKNSFGQLENVIEASLVEIWDFFFSMINHESISIQIAVERCANIFVLKNYPFFPKYIERLIINQSKVKMEGKAANLILELFSFVSPQISAMRIEKFLDSISIIPIFIQKEAILHESVPKHISRLKALGIEWHSQLLTQFIESKIKYPQLKSISAIIKNYPSLFSKLLEIEPVNFSLFSYILSVTDFLFPPISFSDHIIELIAEAKGVAEIDNYLQILSRNVNVTIKIDCNESVTFSYESVSKTIPFDKVCTRAAFYQFDLPFQYLFPSETDSIVILNAKFLKIAQRATHGNCEIIFPIFRDFLLRKYDEMTSACLQSLPICINYFSTHPEFQLFLKQILLVTPSSWFHSVDICRVFGALNAIHFNCLGGLSFVISSLLNYALSSNETLSKTASDAIITISNINNCDKIFKEIYKVFDDFDPFNVCRFLSLLTQLVEKNGYYTFLTCFVTRAQEITKLFRKDLKVLSETLKFAAALRIPDSDVINLLSLKSSAVALTYGYIKFFTGQISSYGFRNQNKIDLLYDAILEYVRSNEFDQIEFTYLFNAFEFLKVYPFDNRLPLIICDDLIRVFPIEVSELAIKHPQNDIMSSFNKVFGIFSDTKNIEVGAIWCKVYINTSHCENEIYDKINAVFENMADFAYSFPQKVTTSCLNILSLFLVKYLPLRPKFANLIHNLTSSQYHENVLKYIYDSDPEAFESIFPEEDPTPYKEKEDYSDSDQSDDVMTEDHYVFEKITAKDFFKPFSSPGSIAIPSQLKRSLINFSVDQLKIIANYFISNSKNESLLELIIYCFRNCREFPFDEIDFSQTPFEKLTKIPNEDIDKFLFYYKTIKDVNVVMDLISLPSMISHIINADKLSKKSLLVVLKSIPLIEYSYFPIDLLLEFTLIVVTKAEDKHLRYAMLILANIVTAQKSIISNFISSFSSIFNENEDRLPLFETLKCIRELAKRCNKDQKLISIINKVNKKLNPDLFSGAALDLLITYLYYISVDNIDALNRLNKFLSYKSIPSFCCRGIQFIYYIFLNSATMQVNTPLKSFAQTLFEIKKERTNNAPIDELHYQSIKFIIDNCIDVQATAAVTRSYETFLIDRANPEYDFSSHILPSLIKKLSPNIMGFKKLQTYVNGLSTSYVSLPVYLKSFVELSLIDPAKSVASRVTDSILEWLQKCIEYDCFEISQIFSQWISLITEHLGPEQTLNLACTQFYKYVPRFFPLFAAIVKFVKGNQDIQSLDEYLENASVVNTCQAHSFAFHLLAKGENIKEALDLAQFEFDCDESQAIIDKLNESK